MRMPQIDPKGLGVDPLPGESDETPERFDPAAMRGELIETEHLARYRFASGAVAGKRVLDAGCGWGYGANMLALADAESVVGIDISESVIESARAAAEPVVELIVGNILELPFDDGEFDVVVCFELIAHVEQQQELLDELRRVLATDGLLLISTPNDEVYGRRNPHHKHQFNPAEFRSTLEDRFANVAIHAQQNWITSMISSHEILAGEDVDLNPMELLKTGALAPGEETYLIAAASDTALPRLGSAAVLGRETELRRWLEMWEFQDERLRQYTDVIENFRFDNVAEMQRRFVASRLELAALERRAEQAERDLEAIRESPSWRITRPLRQSRLLRRTLRRRVAKSD
jgi:2-polyprenyl-3-methyl-5-hydroxy-6-metoxy-1,4-benzoquinol methylase